MLLMLLLLLLDVRVPSAAGAKLRSKGSYCRSSNRSSNSNSSNSSNSSSNSSRHFSGSHLRVSLLRLLCLFTFAVLLQ